MSAPLPSQPPESSFPLPTQRVVGILWHTLSQALCLVSYAWHHISNPRLCVSFLTRTRAIEFVPHPHPMWPPFNLTDHIGKRFFPTKTHSEFRGGYEFRRAAFNPQDTPFQPKCQAFFIFSPLESVTHGHPSAQGSTYTADCSWN